MAQIVFFYLWASMKDLIFSWAAVLGGFVLQDINVALAACSYLGASIYTGIKIYRAYKRWKD